MLAKFFAKVLSAGKVANFNSAGHPILEAGGLAPGKLMNEKGLRFSHLESVQLHVSGLVELMTQPKARLTECQAGSMSFFAECAG